jgi:hypothetical protein
MMHILMLFLYTEKFLKNMLDIMLKSLRGLYLNETYIQYLIY